MWALAASATSIAAGMVALLVAVTRVVRRILTTLDAIADNTADVKAIATRLDAIERKVDDRNGRA